MDQIRIKIIKYGLMPYSADIDKIKNWKSSIFQIVNIEDIALRENSDGDSWEYTDELLTKNIPSRTNCDFLLILINVQLAENYYLRRIEDNKAVFSFYGFDDVFQQNNTPMENAVLRVLYGLSLIYKRSNNILPKKNPSVTFTHDETRGCIFDMNGCNRNDLIQSCSNPIICDECEEKLRQERVSLNIIKIAKNELKKIKKKAYYRCQDLIKKHPVKALI